jgi:hypothetical protein
MRNAAIMAAVVVALAATVAHANTVTAKFTTMVNKEAVHVKNGSQGLYVWAGLSKFEKMSINPNTEANPAYYLDDVFSGYCIDLKEEIWWDFVGTWQVQPLEAAPVGAGQPPMGTDRATLLRRLWGSYFTDPNNAEFQVAAWELLAEDPAKGYNVKNGDFYAPYANEVDRDGINGWLTTVADDNYSGPVASVMYALVSDGVQDFAVLIETGGQPIPEPLTLTGLLMGIGGLIHYARKRGGRASVR